MNIISTMEVPISSREDIINLEEKGQNVFDKFVGSRLEKKVPASPYGIQWLR